MEVFVRSASAAVGESDGEDALFYLPVANNADTPPEEVTMEEAPHISSDGNGAGERIGNHSGRTKQSSAGMDA